MLRTNSPVTWILILKGREYEVSSVQRSARGLAVTMKSWSGGTCRFTSPDHDTVGELLKMAVEAGQAEGRSAHLLRRYHGRGVSETLVL